MCHRSLRARMFRNEVRSRSEFEASCAQLFNEARSFGLFAKKRNRVKYDRLYIVPDVCLREKFIIKIFIRHCA